MHIAHATLEHEEVLHSLYQDGVQGKQLKYMSPSLHFTVFVEEGRYFATILLLSSLVSFQITKNRFK